MSSLSRLLVSTVAAAVLIYVVYLLYVFITGYVRCRRKLRKFPTDSRSALFGHLLKHPALNDAGLAYRRALVSKFPMLSVQWMVNVPVLMVVHPSTLAVVLKAFRPKASWAFNLVRPWIGNGLFTSDGKKWERARSLLTTAFQPDTLKPCVQINNRCADILVETFVTAAQTEEPVECFSSVGMCALDVLLKSTMTYETDCQLLGTKHPLVEAVTVIQDTMTTRFYQPWLYNDFIFSLTPTGRKFFEKCDYLHHMIETIIKKRQAKLDYNTQDGDDQTAVNGGRLYSDFLDTMLASTKTKKNGVYLTLEEIKDEINTLIFTGYESVTAVICWALYSIAEHPKVQTRIQSELDSVLNQSDHQDVTWEDLRTLPYLTMVIKETLRLHTPVHSSQRVLTEDTVIDGRVAPRDTLVSCDFYSMHHNPLLWPVSMEFDPDRFLPENVKGRHPHAFMPFSIGPRRCVGQDFAMDEIKILLARILHRVTIRLDPDHVVERCERVVIRAKNDIRLLVSLRG